MRRFALLSSSALLADAVRQEIAGQPDIELLLIESLATLVAQEQANQIAGIIYDAAPGAQPQNELAQLLTNETWVRTPVLVLIPPTQTAGELKQLFPNVVSELSKPLKSGDLLKALDQLSRSTVELPSKTTPSPSMKSSPQEITQSLPGVTDAFMWSESGQVEYASSARATQFNTTMGFALQVANRMGKEAELGDFTGLQIQGDEGSAVFFSALTDKKDPSQFRTFGLLMDGTADPETVMESLQAKVIS